MKVIVAVLICIVSFKEYAHAQQYFRTEVTRCTNPNKSPGTCVSVYDCQTVLSVLERTPLQQHDAEFVKKSECFNGYGRGPYVCCTGDTGFTRPQREAADYDYNIWDDSQRSSVFFPSNSRTEIPQQRQFNNPRLRGSRNRGTTNRAVTTSAPSAISLLPQAPTCGGVTIQNKIYGGTNADLNEFPWMVLLEYQRKSGGMDTNCAGSLINQRYVLTAAHCLKGAIEKQVGQLVAIRLGEHDMSRDVDCNQYRCAQESYRVGIEEIIPHELYKDTSSNKENDIGLVRIDRNVRFSDAIRPICLPWVVRENAPTGTSNKEYTVAGWGRTLKSARSAIKQKLNVAEVELPQCRSKFLERKVNIVDSQLCAGGRYAEDSCEGDSGGPLMRFRNGAWVLEGVVSFGYKCGLKGWPAVHTRVSTFSDWIHSKLKA